MRTTNNYTLLLLTLTFFTYNLTLAQKPSRHYIDSVILQKDTALSFHGQIMYVVNGVPYDTLTIDSILSTFDIKSLLDVSYWDGRKHGYQPFYGDVVIIVFAQNQRTKYKRKVFKTARTILSDSSLPAVLLIDNKQINRTLMNSTFNRLRLNDIMYIDTVKLKDSTQIRIWTQQKTKPAPNKGFGKMRADG